MHGIIFDLDGTLWDSREAVAKIWNETLRVHCEKEMKLTAESFTPLFGKPLEEIWDIIFASFPEEERIRLGKLCLENQNSNLKKEECIYYEGMKEGIRRLAKEYQLFIVSNCQSGYIETFLEKSRLKSYFRDYACPGDTGMLKADNIRLIIERNNLEHAVYLGDTQGDADACEHVGLPFAFAAYGLGHVKDAKVNVRCFEEFVNLM